MNRRELYEFGVFRLDVADRRLSRGETAIHETPAPSSNGAAWIRLAVLNADAGDLDAAFDHLDHAMESRDPSLVHLGVAPQWDGLRTDPRFKDRLSQMRL